MKLKKMTWLFIAAAIMMSTAWTAFADETSDFFADFHPVVQHEIIADNEDSNHVLKAQARVAIPEGVTVDSGDFTWVINMAEDPLNPISDSIKHDSSKDETDNITDDNASRVQTSSSDYSDDISFDNDGDNDSEVIDDDNNVPEESGTLEGQTYTSRVKAKGGTVITGECEVTFGLIVELDIPMAEDMFNIGLEASPSSTN